MYNYKLARLKFLLMKISLDSLNIFFPVFHDNIICLPSKCGNFISLGVRFYAWFVAELSVDEQFGTFPRAMCTRESYVDANETISEYGILEELPRRKITNCQ